jgi:hypothetical protein
LGQADRALANCLAGHTNGIVIDLHHLDDPRAGSAALWLTAHAQGATLHPQAPVLAALPPTTTLATRLNRPGARQHLPVFATVSDAHAALNEHGPFTDQLRLALPPVPDVHAALKEHGPFTGQLRLALSTSPAAAARDAVADACRRWHVTPLIPIARLVISELVINATEHARPPIDVTISRLGPAKRTSGVHVAVYDRDPRLPLRPPDITTAPTHRGLGLRVVDAAAYAWGALPTPTGKMVWATLRPPPPARVPLSHPMPQPGQRRSGPTP